MADEMKPAVPLGAQILRKFYAGCKALSESTAAAHGALDECEAKGMIGEHLATLGGSTAAIEKAFGKLYKGVDLIEEQLDEPEDPDEETPVERPAKPERQIKSDDEDEDDEMTSQEKSAIVSRIKMLESKTRHIERLRRVAASRR